jgi:CheY-like chemotaxis protein
MTVSPMPPLSRSLRVFCLEDNPLIVFHLQYAIEDLGHVFAGSAESFADLQAGFADLRIDCALVDIDLADGRTGPAAAAWLAARHIPAIFVTGQDGVAAEHAGTVVAVVSKPVLVGALSDALDRVPSDQEPTGSARRSSTP